MLVMTLEKVPPRLRGSLTRWLVEIQSGVYVGRVNKVVRDLLWEKGVQDRETGRITQAWNTNSDQGFDFRIHGDEMRRSLDLDGLKVIALMNAKAKAKIGPKRAESSKTVINENKTGT